jgi:hypothetical protein
MEERMVRCRDRPRLTVRESFEVTRVSQQCLISAYTRLFPIRRESVRSGSKSQGHAGRQVRRGGGKHA